MQRVVGLISGTSMDGIDVAVADLRLAGKTVELTPLGHRELPYPAELKAGLLAALPPHPTTAEAVCQVDTAVGQAFAAAAHTALEQIAPDADLIASLGQTVYHWVDGGRCLGTLQLGQPAWIAESTGLPVVADLRVRDVAAGGHGAPLVGILDELWLRGQRTPTAALNIGGIANITVVASGASTLAYDTGPGNALLDAACREFAGREYDVDGALAASGTVHAELLGELLADPYYAAPAPKSTGKEHFHAEYLREALRGRTIAANDLLATLTELTAATVAAQCRQHEVTRVVVSGGGAANPSLMAALAARLAPAELLSSERLGLPAGGKEAYLAALLGFLTWHGVAGTVPGATGASGPRVLGNITPGRTPLRLPEPADVVPQGLTVLDNQDLIGSGIAGGNRARG